MLKNKNKKIIPYFIYISIGIVSRQRENCILAKPSSDSSTFIPENRMVLLSHLTLFTQGQTACVSRLFRFDGLLLLDEQRTAWSSVVRGWTLCPENIRKRQEDAKKARYAEEQSESKHIAHGIDGTLILILKLFFIELHTSELTASMAQHHTVLELCKKKKTCELHGYSKKKSWWWDGNINRQQTRLGLKLRGR